MLNASPEDIRALAPLIESILELRVLCVIRKRKHDKRRSRYV